MAAVTIWVILEPLKIKSDTVSTVSPSISHEVMGPDAMIFIFWMYPSDLILGFPVAQLVKNLPAVWETWARSLGWEDPLEKGMATDSSILAWRIPQTEAPGRLQSMGLQRVRHNWVTFTHAHTDRESKIPYRILYCFNCICIALTRKTLTWLHLTCLLES